MNTARLQQWLIGIFSILLIVALLIVAGVEMKKTRVFKPEIEIDDVTSQCINCHVKKGIAVKLIDEWKNSQHAVMGIGCMECHEANEDDFDAFRCPESEFLVGLHPTPKDCENCHDQQVKEFLNCKHAVAQVMMALKGSDRNVFEPTIATKHGCEQCHNIGNYWPDGSIGECDACHSKHRFSIAQARHPETCGECHMGPDHPNIETYLESKHGNLYISFGNQWDWNYTPGDSLPFNAPTCATCHMSATLTTKNPTHNVSERLAWEIQSPFSVRTQPYWGGITWQEKRARMEGVCLQCHAESFVKRYFLVADLSILQYNEIWKATIRWMNILKKAGVIETDRFSIDGKFLTSWPIVGYDQEIEHLAYRNWHHEGRRFRQGAIMMGADFTQWHGIWDLQENLVKIIEYGAEHGVPDALNWVKSKDPDKFIKIYPVFDIPGSTWGPTVLAYRGNMAMDRIKNYWEVVYKNVKMAYEKGLLTQEQWNLYNEIYNNKDIELGRDLPLPKIHDEYLRELKVDLKELYTKQKIEPIILK